MSNDTSIPPFPEFAPISLAMRDELYPGLNMLADGVSEFTFSNLYLFRSTYGYRLSRLPTGCVAIEGSKDGKSFFSLPSFAETWDIVDELMRSHDFMKNLSETAATAHRIGLEARGYQVSEDRDNFDYLYYRKDLAELSGREYHKKRNQVNGFINNYECEQRPLRKDNVTDALAVLDEWRAAKGYEGDYAAAREGLERFELLGMRGAVYYVKEEPVGWCLGESLAKGKSFAIHFEKACDRFKGIYQFINQAFAQSLPAHHVYINREQDLGNEGLRQAKMTYRPCGFVRKYRVLKPGVISAPPEPMECGPGTGHECQP